MLIISQHISSTKWGKACLWAEAWIRKAGRHPLVTSSLLVLLVEDCLKHQERGSAVSLAACGESDVRAGHMLLDATHDLSNREPWALQWRTPTLAKAFVEDPKFIGSLRA